MFRKKNRYTYHNSGILFDALVAILGYIFIDSYIRYYQLGWIIMTTSNPPMLVKYIDFHT